MTCIHLSRCLCCLLLAMLILAMFTSELNARPTVAPAHPRTTPGHVRHGHNHGSHHGRHPPRPSSRPAPAIARPGACRDSEAIFTDCFMCGRVSDQREIYQGCCLRDPTIMNYCEQYGI